MKGFIPNYAELWVTLAMIHVQRFVQESAALVFRPGWFDSRPALARPGDPAAEDHRIELRPSHPRGVGLVVMMRNVFVFSDSLIPQFGALEFLSGGLQG